jgi:hypothetical protein
MQDLTDKQFGRWTVLSYAGKTPKGVALWLCRCQCGTERVVRGGNLRSGMSTSCWCSKDTHGMSDTPVYKAWTQMKQRCYNANDPQYHNYGARGITVCDRWRLDFAQFLTDMGERPKGMTLDRIDNNGPYAPDNCRWATDVEQCNNTRVNHVLAWNGRTQTIAQWAKVTGLSYNVIRYRILHGWTIEHALTHPVS